MTEQEQEQLAQNLRIEVYENKDLGVCPISAHFQTNWKTGITIIDGIETTINDDAAFDGIKVVNKTTGNSLFYLEGQKALLLDDLAEYLIAKLELVIRKL